MKKLLVGIMRRNRNSSDPELKIYKDILDYNEIPCIYLDINQPDFWDEVKKLDLLIYKWGHDHQNHQVAASILPVIEISMGIKCFPDWSTCWHYDDKVKQYYLLKENGFPIVDSYIFWDKATAKKWLFSHDEFPIVHKLKNGAGSIAVKLVKTKRQAQSLINKMFGRGVLQTDFSFLHLTKILNYDPVKIFRHYAISFRNRYVYPERRQFWVRHKNYVYFQKYLPGNQWDTRVTTAGSKAHAFRRFTRPDDFRASGSNRWDINPENIDMRMVKMAMDISRHFGFQAMAYDFVYDENRKPEILEISYLYGGAGYPDFMNGYWDEDLKWHEGRYWPQYFELMELLEMPSMKLPLLDTLTSYKSARIV